MDNSKAILHLSACFPTKSEDYLRKMYRKCNCDINTTVNAINNDKPEKKNIFGRFFENIINCLVNIIPGNVTQSAASSTSTNAQNPETSSRYDEKFFEINIGEEFAAKLQEKFSDPSLILPKGFQPVIEIPVALGRQLYVAYVESIFRQQEAYDQIITQLVKEDKEFARKLQEEGESESVVHSKSFLEEYTPEGDKLTDIDAAIGNVYISHDTRTTLKERQVFPQEKFVDFPKKVITEIDETDAVLSHPPIFYRDQAQQHLKKRQQLYERAKQCLRGQNKSLANHYFQQAQQQTKLFEKANSLAAAAFLAENKQRNPSKNTIDLHHLFVKEAIQALDIFLDDEISALQDQFLEKKSVMVITGRGKHSLHGIPKIKPAVMKRLNARGLQYSEINPGLLKVHIFRHSYLTNDLMRTCY